MTTMDIPCTTAVLAHPLSLSNRLGRIKERIEEELDPDTGLHRLACVEASEELGLLHEEMERVHADWPQDQLQYLLTHTDCSIKILDTGTRYGLWDRDEFPVMLQHLDSAHRQLVRPSSIPQLPTEVIRIILTQIYAEHAMRETSHLRACSLVHSSWCEIAQRLLFSSLYIQHTSHFDCISNAVKLVPRLAGYIKEFYITTSENEAQKITDVSDFVGRLRCLKTLTVRHQTNFHSRHEVIVPFDCSVLDGFKDLLLLSLHSATWPDTMPHFISLQHLGLSLAGDDGLPPTLAAHFPNLTSLSLDGLHSDSTRAQHLVEQLSSCLTYLSIGNFQLSTFAQVRHVKTWIDLLPSLIALQELSICTSVQLPPPEHLLTHLPPKLESIYLPVNRTDDESQVSEATLFGPALLKAKERRRIPATLETISLQNDSYEGGDTRAGRRLHFGVTKEIDELCESWKLDLFIDDW